MGNAWLERRQMMQQATLNASEETMMQFCLDVTCLILHEEFGFGSRRLERFLSIIRPG